jgi:hypothetical protein
MTRSRFPGQFFGFTLSDQLDRMRIYLELLQEQFYRWGYILGWIGAWERLKADLKSFGFLALVALGIYVFAMNYGGGTVRIYLIPSYMIFAVFLGCGFSAMRRWLAGLLQSRPKWLAQPLLAAMAALMLVLPLYPLWQNWAEVDQSDNTYYRDLARSFVEQAGPGFVLVEAEDLYDDLEAILYVAWIEKGWYDARTVTPGGIDRWLGRRPIYIWSGATEIDPRYVQEPVTELPGMALITGVRQE